MCYYKKKEVGMTFRQLGHFDVIVMGAGSAGATAAIAAARTGSNVLVIDRLTFCRWN